MGSKRRARYVVEGRAPHLETPGTGMIGTRCVYRSRARRRSVWQTLVSDLKYDDPFVLLVATWALVFFALALVAIIISLGG